MSRLPILAYGAVLLLSIYEIMLGTFTILLKYYVPLFWDEWDLMNFFSGRPGSFDYLKEAFRPQNEHIIATTKLLFFIDYNFFSLTNLFMVGCTILTCFFNAYLLSMIFFDPKDGRIAFWLGWLAFTAASLSLVQYENLLWGFQPQFFLAIFGALLSIYLSLQLVKGRKTRTMIGVILAMAFCIFSMGNGTAIPFIIVGLLVLYRAPKGELVILATVGAALDIVFFALTHNKVVYTGESPKKIAGLRDFLFTVIGNPFSSDLAVAWILGLVLTCCFVVILTFTVVRPFLQRRSVDPRLAGLFAFAAFLMATAAAAAWGRVSFGTEYALSSRYATPTLMLWIVVCGILVRVPLHSPGLRRLDPLMLPAFLMIVVSASIYAGRASRTASAINERSYDIEQAGYFLLSGVAASDPILRIYHTPSLVIRMLPLLQEGRLNIFAAHFGLHQPPVDILIKDAKSEKLLYCENQAIDRISRLDQEDWQIVGWAAVESNDIPSWVVAYDQSGRILGFTPALIPRPDVAKEIGSASEFRGFRLPLHVGDAKSVKISIVAISEKPLTSCRLPDVSKLPDSLLPIPSVRFEPVPVELRLSGEVGSPGVPPSAQVHDLTNYGETVGTWKTSDQDTGSVEIDVGDDSCKDLVLPVIHGPSIEGISLNISSSDETTHPIDLSLFPRHSWAFFKINPAQLRVGSEKNDPDKIAG